MRPDDPKHDPKRDEAQAALREAAWLRSLARALVGSEADAADLAQDVHLAALTGAAPAERAPRRAWLRTVARRIARRRAGREADRRAGERVRAEEARGAASESPAADAVASRLALQRRLADALERLPEADQELLVRRHFDGAAAPEIAAELGVSPAAVRQRLVRATDRLRAEFARTDEQWRAWSPALAAAAFGPTGAPGAAGLLSTSRSPRTHTPSRSLARTKPAAAAASSLVLLAIMKKLTLAAAAVLSLAAALWLITTPADVGRPGNASSAARAEIEPLDGLQTAGGPDLGRVEAETERDDSAAARPEAPAEIIVMDTSHRPVQGVRGVWIDAITGKSVELDFDAEGRAPRPAGESATVVVLGLEHRLTEVPIRSALDPAGPILLEPAPILRGRLVVDGAPPERHHGLETSEQLWGHDSSATSSASPDSVFEWLAPRGRSTPIATPDREGVFHVHVRGNGIRIRVSQSLELDGVTLDGQPCAVPEDGSRDRPWLDVPSTVRNVVIRGSAASGPRARFVHEETNEVYTGAIEARFAILGGTTRTLCDPDDGSAVIPLPRRNTPHPPGTRAAMVVTAPINGIDVLVHYWMGEAHELPELDLGTLSVPTPQPVRVRVVEARGGERVPASNARLCVNYRVTELDRNGRGEIWWPEGERASVVADGCRIRDVERPDSADGEYVIDVEPGPSLVVEPVASTIEEQLFVDVARVDGSPVMSGPSGMQVLLARDAAPVGGSITYSISKDGASTITSADSVVFRLPPGQPLKLSGLEAGAELLVQVTDQTGAVLESQRVALDESVEYRVAPRVDRSGLARLRIDISDASTHAMATYFIKIERPDGRRSASVPVFDPQALIGPLEPGLVVVQVIERGAQTRRSERSVVLGDGLTTLSVELGGD